MKAAILEEIGKLNIKDIPKPFVKDDTILIKVDSCAVCGTDIKVYHHGHRLIRPPRVIGHELSGTIIEVGKDIKNFKKNDRVAVAPAVPCGECYYCQRGIQGMCDNLTAIGYHYDGGFAEYMEIPSIAIRNGCVNIIPENVSFEEASIAEPLACAINGQELSGVKLGDVVVVIGAGPLGCFHVELARANGASKTILIELSTSRLEMSKKCEANVFIDSSKEDAVKRVLEETNTRGADIVITACSSGKAQEQALQMIAKRGNINFFGGLPKDKSIINFDSNLIHYKEFFVAGTHGSSPRHNSLALQLISSGKIAVKKYITHHLTVDKVLDGIGLVEKGESLKVIIKP
jgi:L-iditol 2-dehydrogenase